MEGESPTLKDGRRLDTGTKKINEEPFIQNTMKRFSFDNKDTFVCFVTSSLDKRHYLNVYTLFLQESVKLNPGLVVLKFLMFLRVYCSQHVLIFSRFFLFSFKTHERKKKKDMF